MYRGTTPTIKVKINGFDTMDIREVYATLKQTTVEITKTVGNGVTIDMENNVISVNYTQEETMKLSGGVAYFQLRVKTYGGKVLASKVVICDVNEILYNEVV